MPWPILTLMSFVGLMTYAAIGAVIGTLTVRVFDQSDNINRQANLYSNGSRSPIRGLAGKSDGNEEGWSWFWLATALWPAGLCLVIAGAAIGAVVIGPVWLAYKIGTYGANAMIKEEVGA